MILTIDVGNTNIVIGAFKEDELVAHWRMTTNIYKSSDELGIFIYNILKHNKIAVEQIENVVIASVVPDIMLSLENGIKKYLNIEPLIVGPGIKTGINIRTDNPKELGADRIVNAVAALYLYGSPAIVIDFGTATTFDVISEEGSYIGGVISPGINISADALWQRAAKLPKVEIQKPNKIIGKNTVDSMQAGLFYGYVGQVDYIVKKIKKELNSGNVKVIATGGLARLIAEESKAIEEVNDFISLHGLKIIYEKNK
ncbi:MAG TPA: type III pantothenate kinase [Defluviitaleaceae bacterium]|jgi:type III pantothenate kinase|nr:type III pantothenate kinase [Candidatus Epulonipiscium sp.]HOA79746.1 type III pantothenate kinase [Defluviitaleaceae bacterium]